jgi:hypothetical protein
METGTGLVRALIAAVEVIILPPFCASFVRVHNRVFASGVFTTPS